MKLTLENIGKVKHAEIDLSKDLIVLCGPNNTGKTYVAYSVYGLYKFGREFPKHPLFTRGFKVFDQLDEISLPEWFFRNEERLLLLLAQELKNYFKTIFSSENDFFESASISLFLNKTAIKSILLEMEIVLRASIFKGVSLYVVKSAQNPIVNVSTQSEGDLPLIPDDVSKELSTKIVAKSILENIFRDVFIAPAERIAINIFSKELSERRTKLVDQLLDARSGSDALEIVKENATRFSLPIRESLATAERMDVYQKEKGLLEHLGEEIEREILQGTVKVSEYGEVRFLPTGSKKDMGIHMAGSVVKSLASIVFYLKHIAKPGDFYIIDEPELTLHPDNQRKMARILTRMVNAGIKVMMSTHSDYIIRELNNLMMLKTDQNPERVAVLMQKYGYKKEELLDHNRVGAYIFTEDVKPLEVGETGFQVKSIDDVIHALNESSMDIFLALHD